jgi:hypothetical protein
MKYLAMIIMDSDSEDCRNYEKGTPTDQKFVAAMGGLIEEMTRRGVLLGTAGLLPYAQGARVRATGGKLTVTDGPFIESKEVIGGYAMMQTKSKEEAVEWGKAFMQLHLDALGASYAGTLEIRQMFDPEDCASERAKS